FQRALSELETAARETPTAIMCAEAVWWRCHRRLIADAAVLQGRPVVHLLAAGKAEAHPPNPAMRRGPDGWPVYDVGVEAPLL
ncbi:MAG TPA: DUF488 family protein, partial [Actinomycetota bacterium]|nr:DUF488 family protein [Actinomycetota bacterium]